MAHFIYIALNQSGGSVKGTVEASDESAVISLLSKQNLRPISIHEGAAKAGGFSVGDFFGKNKVKSDTLVIFTRELSAMVSAGVPLLRALSSLYEHTEKKDQALKDVLQGIIKDVQSGAALGVALEKYPNTFNDVYVNMVKAGEAAGILDDILKRLAMQQEKSASIRKKIKSAMTYPMVLLTITALAFFGLMIFVIPMIGKILKDLAGPDAELPMITQIMLDASSFMVNYWWILTPLLVGGIMLLLRYIKTPTGKMQFHKLVLKVPAVNKIIVKVAVARFARTFSALMGAGVPILESLSVTAKALGNGVYEAALLDAAEQVKAGANLSKVIEKNPLFPAIVAQMLTVGEETGQTDLVLVKVADFYEEEVDVAIDGISSIIEPVMIVIMGGAVGLIAASVMTPIANLANSIKG